MCPQSVATTSDNRLQTCPVVRSITSWPICSQQVCNFRGLLSGAQCLECDNDGKQAVGVLPRLNSPDLSLGHSAANFLVPQILEHVVCRERWAGAPSCWKVTLLPDSFWMSVNHDSERRYSNKNCRLWLHAEQAPVTFILSSKLQRTPWCSVKNVCGLSKGVP